MIQAWLFDGRSAVRRGAGILPGDGGIRLVAGSGAEAFVASALLTHVESRADVEIYGHREIAGWRLGVPKPIDPELEPLLPQRQVYGRWVDRIGLPSAIAAGIAVSALVVLVGTQVPGWLAPLVPVSWERRFGDALVGDLGGKFCTGDAGQAALAKLTAKLTPRADELKVRVVPLPMVNAAALPGGRIVIFRELLAEADGPDEVAGILAHEIAHVENRDVTRAMIRQFGLGIFLSSVGGTTGANIDTLLSASYSRGAESRADADAIEALERANISPVPTARFFERLSKMEQKLGAIDETFNYISSHPLSGDRRELFLAGADRARAYQPSLSREEWHALQDICHVKQPPTPDS